ncbi:BatA domain-containing protein [Hymenobacter sp. BT770]|uniref:BatA domain-containing protein n=1 Tax=Hymenobacter sp. BT770 TaxID=2886942 RepID=UPI001D12D998|nr:BatA domain-containing protein [Hymenobacter sp. BT770]MCC3152310.1 BatA domain-containing protein [Hymenobacter sp. BT770]MDO3414123.1 BatA domain-containing protein [Hymenobacter sp. BT770]
MFTLLTPSALLALLGLLVPVAIHLWNRRPGREVAVGSLRWLEAGANRRLRNLKPEQLLLLLLRAALLSVLAVALAGPVWRQALPAGRGQVLVSPELIGTPALAASRPLVDSLRRKGYALRWLASGFPKMSRAAWRADSLGQRDSARLLAAVSPSGANFQWARVQQAAGTFPGQPLFVLTPASLRGFQGIQSPLPATITWQALPNAAAETWVQAAALQGDSLRLLLGQSNETRTSFRVVSVARQAAGGIVRLAGVPPLRFETKADGSQLQPITSASGTVAKQLTPIQVRSKPMRIIIYATADYASDARYMQAGLRAAAAGLPVPLALSTTSTPPSPTTSPDWLFWLTDAPLPTAWRDAVKAGAQVWLEAPGAGVVDKASLAVTEADEIPATIFRHSAKQPRQATAAASYPLWTDGRGRAVLSRQKLGQGAFYQLATRLAPAWSDLADNPTLPTRLLALLQPETADAVDIAEPALAKELASHDQRALDPTQLRLSAGAAAGTSAVVTASAVPQSFRQSDLRPWLVLVAGLLFALERLLARRRETQALPSSTVL